MRSSSLPSCPDEFNKEMSSSAAAIDHGRPAAGGQIFPSSGGPHNVNPYQTYFNLAMIGSSPEQHHSVTHTHSDPSSPESRSLRGGYPPHHHHHHYHPYEQQNRNNSAQHPVVTVNGPVPEVSKTTPRSRLPLHCRPAAKTPSDRSDMTTSGYSTTSDSDHDDVRHKKVRRYSNASIGPLKMAAMNGLSMSQLPLLRDDQDVSRIPKDSRRKEMEQKVESGQLFTEFKQIPKGKSEPIYATAQKPENLNRNRFREILPYEESRLSLSTKKSNKLGYINASWIKAKISGQIHKYIATQAPLENTVEDFWQMIWDYDVNIIVMLTLEKEGDKEKCFGYWPKKDKDNPVVTTGPFKIKEGFINDTCSYITTSLIVKNTSTKDKRTVWHIQYTDWPDNGCPDDIAGFLGLIDEVVSIQRHLEDEEMSIQRRPLVVHCSAGVGRSGVFILSMIMMACLEHNMSVDVPKALCHIRQQRMLMVQTVNQYIFVYKVLIQFLKNSRLI